MGKKIYKNKIPRINFKNGKQPTVFIAVIAFILIIILITIFVYNERKNQVTETENRLIDITERDAAVVRNLFDAYVAILQAISFNMENFDDLTSAESIRFLRKMEESFKFEYLSIDFPNGKSYTTNGIEHNITDEKHLAYLKSDQIFISNLYSSIDNIPMISVRVPINKNSQTVAFIGSILTREALNSLFKSVLAEENRCFYIIDDYGEYVAYLQRENAVFPLNINFFEVLDRIIFAVGSSKEQVLQVFTDTKAVNVEYWFERHDRQLGCFFHIGINNWVIVLIASKNEIESNTNRFLIKALTFAGQIFMIFLVVVISVFLNQIRSLRLSELNEWCLNILAQHTGKVVFEWNYINKTMQYTNLEQTIGQKQIEANLNSADGVIATGTVHPEDHEVVCKIFSDIMDGRDLENLRIRLRITDGTYHFFEVSSIVVFDTKEKPYKSIGFLENIDSQVHTENNLRHMANIDQLTKLYNKTAAETLISDIISMSDGETKHAMLCIDLDNFKSINDDFGHLYGDKVLKEIADNIKKLFRTSDIIGRFGGDEFVIFVRNIPNIALIEEKATELNKCLNRTYSNDDIVCTVSASIGIAIFPNDGDTYKTLYQKADEASYIVKNSGKNSYSFFVKNIK